MLHIMAEKETAEPDFSGKGKLAQAPRKYGTVETSTNV